MDALFETALTFRQHLLLQLEKIDDDQLDVIPEGFSNSIRWNLAHLVVTPGLLTYRLAGEEVPLISTEFIDSAKKGSCPDDLSLNEDFGFKHLSELLVETVKQGQRDFEDLSQKSFKAYETSTGYVISDLPSALSYSNIHDGMHIGTMKAMLRQLDD